MEESITQKRCTKCGQWKPTWEFHHNKIRADGLHGQCKTCRLADAIRYQAEHKQKRHDYLAKYYVEHREEQNIRSAKWAVEHPEKVRTRAREWAARNPDKVRAKELARKYGLTPEGYSELLATQNGVCAICGKTPNSKNLCVDHDHNTGKIRGLLCDRCNTVLGQVQDSLDILAKAMEYLRQDNR